MQRYLYIVLYALLLVGCTTTPPSTTVSPHATRTLSPHATSSPPLIQRASDIAELTPTVSESSSQITSDEGGDVVSQILYYEYEYFQLEGIPPYPGPYLTIDSIDRYWVDVNDPNRFRYERYYRTRETEPKEGIEVSRVGTGLGGVVEECQRYEDKTECTQQAATTPLTYDNWLSNTTHLSRKFLNNINSPATIGGYEYRGIENDELWGDVHVFERRGTLSASDIYPNFPIVETLKFDIALGRTVEWRRIVIDGDKSVIHAVSRLVKWELIDGSTVSTDLFLTREAAEK